MAYNNFGRFVIFISLISFSSAIAGPFFAVYMLKNLNFQNIEVGYVFYFIITLSNSLFSILSMSFWGKLIDKYGTVRIMKKTGLLIPLVPFIWIPTIFFSGNITFLILYLVVIEAFSGFVWAGFNLANGNFIYSATTREKMPLCVAYFGLLNSFGAFIGATFGGWFSSFDFVLFGMDSILWLFIISGIARFIVYLFFSKRFVEVRDGVNKEDFEVYNELRRDVKKISKNLLSLSRIQFFEFLRIKGIRPREFG